MSMAFVDSAEDVQRELSIPILNPASVSRKTGELQIRLGCVTMHTAAVNPIPSILEENAVKIALDLPPRTVYDPYRSNSRAARLIWAAVFVGSDVGAPNTRSSAGGSGTPIDRA